jgi:hypothetical protein
VPSVSQSLLPPACRPRQARHGEPSDPRHGPIRLLRRGCRALLVLGSHLGHLMGLRCVSQDLPSNWGRLSCRRVRRPQLPHTDGPEAREQEEGRADQERRILKEADHAEDADRHRLPLLIAPTTPRWSSSSLGSSLLMRAASHRPITSTSGGQTTARPWRPPMCASVKAPPRSFLDHPRRLSTLSGVEIDLSVWPNSPVNHSFRPPPSPSPDRVRHRIGRPQPRPRSACTPLIGREPAKKATDHRADLNADVPVEH